MEASWREGIPANIMLVVLDYYLVPFALFLGATPVEIGFLVAIPHLLGSLSQLIAVQVVKKMGSRLRCLVEGSKIQAAFLIPVASLALIPFPGRILALIVMTSIFRILANLIGTAWGSLVSEYLQPTQRGRYLGWRAQVAGIAGVGGLCFAGILLYYAEKYFLALGFFVLFIGIAGCRFFSCYLFQQMADRPMEDKPGSHFTFLQFIRGFRRSNYVRYVLYVASITFATQLASPYFSVYMLKDLQFSYLTYMSVHMSAVITGFISFPIWGSHADHVGNARVLKTVSVLIPVIPFLWLVSKNPFYLIGVESFSGFVWGGFTLSAANYIFDAVTPAKRVRCLGYFNFINGSAVFLGAALGGFLAERLPPIFGFPLLTLFLLSGSLRFAAHFFLSGHFQEVRKGVRPASNADLFFSVLGIRPLIGRNREWNILSFMKKPYS
ncbi:MAG: MFS transporter [Candidatus Omnitrophota bacterium]|nr:MFS transporter [Candidatus Omnitrophota bacterium]